jgi:PelA/Pel-15E family pectate lyase
MGHLFLDAYHATRDEYYYKAAESVAAALINAQHRSGGWNYLADFGGNRSLQEWYDTVGRNAWRMEEFQHNWDNATFDDAGTAESAKFLLRLYVEKRNARYKPALDKVIGFVLDSQYPVGAWPQRYPLKSEFSHHGNPDYTSYITFNDDVAGENIDFLLMCYQALGETRVLDAITRGMNAFLVTQQAAPQPGWSLQYTTDLKPAAARTYEPRALATHTTATNLQLLMRFYRLTGDPKFLARIPETLDWLEALALPPGVATRPGTTHPTFIEIGSNKPLYVHREGSNVVNGRYFFDYSPQKTLAHYSAFRRVDVAGLRKQYEALRRMSRDEAVARSPLEAKAGAVPLERFFAVEQSGGSPLTETIASLNKDGYWPAPLGYNSHPFKRQGTKEVAPGDFSQTHVGDETDTSPFPDDTLSGISTAAYIRHMSVLIRALDAGGGLVPSASSPTRAPVDWRLETLQRIGGHPVTVVGNPKVVDTDIGPAIAFDGADDGLFVDVNPLDGLKAFTVETVFKPAPGGPEEQRFLHFEEARTGNRALMELRRRADDRWALDTYLRSGEAGLTLLDRNRTHPADRWYVAALTYDGKTMTHYVDGVREMSGETAFAPLQGGRTSIGVRQNRVSWFKGQIHRIRVTGAALTPPSLLDLRASR